MITNLKIRSKILLILALLGAVALAVLLIGAEGMAEFRKQNVEANLCSKRAILGEKVNACVLSVVMESRGLYFAQGEAQVEKFAKPLLETLQTLQRLQSEWKAILPQEQKAGFAELESATKEFVEFRTQLVQLAREGGAALARPYGDNEANRNNRKKLNESVVAFAERNTADIEKMLIRQDRFYKQRLVTSSAGVCVGILVAIAVGLYVGQVGIARPIALVSEGMLRLGRGDLGVHIPENTRTDEIGEIGNALNSMVGDWCSHVRTLSNDANSLTNSSGELSLISKRVSDTAHQTSTQAQVVNRAATQVSGDLHSVAVAVEEMSASMAEITRNTAEATMIANRAAAATRSTDTTVAKLGDSTDQISDVIKAITGIAAQTNLLALNATIEAARAGDAGKGFAVVAQEVKELALQTGKATEEIGQRIAAIQTDSGQAITSIREISSIIAQIDMNQSVIAGAIEEQSAAINEISRSLSNATRASKEISANIGTVADATEETTTAAAHTAGAAAGLAEIAERLRHVIGQFQLPA